MAGEGHHVLTNDDVQALDRRAREVGDVIGWDLQFVVAPNAEYVGLAAGGGAEHAEEIIVLGPSRITDIAVHEIDLALDALQRGERHIILDEDGDPRLSEHTAGEFFSTPLQSDPHSGPAQPDVQHRRSRC